VVVLAATPLLLLLLQSCPPLGSTVIGKGFFMLMLSVALLLCIRLGDVTGFSPSLSLNAGHLSFQRATLSARHSPKAPRRDLRATSLNGDAENKDASKNVVRIYKDYATRLWNETNPVARERIAQDKAVAAVRRVEQIMTGEEYVAFTEESEEARQQLLRACQKMLKVMNDKPRSELSTTEEVTTNKTVAVVDTSTETSAKAKKPRRSILFGAAMGAIVACWVFSGNYIFTGLFTLMTILGQLEYYRMVMNTGIYPARRISIVGACSMFLTVRRYYSFLYSGSVAKLTHLTVSL